MVGFEVLFFKLVFFIEFGNGNEFFLFILGSSLFILNLFFFNGNNYNLSKLVFLYRLAVVLNCFILIFFFNDIFSFI